MPRVRRFALALAIGALAPLLAADLASPGAGAGSADAGGVEVGYTYGETEPDARAISVVLSLLIAGGAAAVWTARSSRRIGSGLLAGALGLALTPAAFAEGRPDRLTVTAARAIRPGMDVEQVKAIAGRPAGRGTGVARTGAELSCLAYAREGDPFPKLYCFAAGRLVAVSQ